MEVFKSPASKMEPGLHLGLQICSNVSLELFLVLRLICLSFQQPLKTAKHRQVLEHIMKVILCNTVANLVTPFMALFNAVVMENGPVPV